MATIDELVIKIKSDVRDATTGINQVQTMTSRMGTRVKGVLQSVRQHWMAYAAAVMGTAYAIKTAISWSAEEEAVSVRTAALLRQQGIEWSNVKDSLDKYFKSLEKLTGYNDTDVQEAFNQLIVTGVRYGDAMSNLKIVLDVAYSTNMDLRTSAMYVGRAIQGDANMLARYIPRIRELNKEQRTWNNIQKILSNSMADSSERSKSLYGRIDDLKNQFHNLVEALASELLPTLEDLTEKIKNFVESGDVLKLAGSIKILSDIVTILCNDLQMSYHALMAFWNALTLNFEKAKYHIRMLKKDFREFAKAGYDLRTHIDEMNRSIEKGVKDQKDLEIQTRKTTEAMNEELTTIQEISKRRFGFAFENISEVRRWLEGGGGRVEATKAGITKIEPRIEPRAIEVRREERARLPPDIEHFFKVDLEKNLIRTDRKAQNAYDAMIKFQEANDELASRIEEVASQPKTINVHIEKIVSEEDYAMTSKKVAEATARGAGVGNWTTR